MISAENQRISVVTLVLCLLLVIVGIGIYLIWPVYEEPVDCTVPEFSKLCRSNGGAYINYCNPEVGSVCLFTSNESKWSSYTFEKRINGSACMTPYENKEYDAMKRNFNNTIPSFRCDYKEE